MFSNIIYPYIKFTLGTLYPTYKTWKALKRKDETNRVSLELVDSSHADAMSTCIPLTLVISN